MSATMSFGIQCLDREDFKVLTVGGYMGNTECEKLEVELEELFRQGRRQIKSS